MFSGSSLNSRARFQLIIVLLSANVVWVFIAYFYHLNTIEAVCKKQGKKYMFSIGRSKHLIDTHKKLGWHVESKSSYELVKTI